MRQITSVTQQSYLSVYGCFYFTRKGADANKEEGSAFSFPPGAVRDKIFIMIFFEFIGCSLPGIVCGYTDIGTDSFFTSIVIETFLRFCWNHIKLIGINALLAPSR